MKKLIFKCNTNINTIKDISLNSELKTRIN
ncbi:hypothetical protein J2810_002680 [Chryseobacterium rhizosphaerae]|nr:hypothetical protein [Chryseobacterium rhizosphaerae]